MPSLDCNDLRSNSNVVTERLLSFGGSPELLALTERCRSQLSATIGWMSPEPVAGNPINSVKAAVRFLQVCLLAQRPICHQSLHMRNLVSLANAALRYGLDLFQRSLIRRARNAVGNDPLVWLRGRCANARLRLRTGWVSPRAEFAPGYTSHNFFNLFLVVALIRAIQVRGKNGRWLWKAGI